MSSAPSCKVLKHTSQGMLSGAGITDPWNARMREGVLMENGARPRFEQRLLGITWKEGINVVIHDRYTSDYLSSMLLLKYKFMSTSLETVS